LVATMAIAWKPDRMAVWLLAPYLLWVSYATYLNAGLFRLNG
jgi:tryptophan-rich sensory protein